MFAVQKDGNTAYTRNGSFSINSDRELVTNQGLPVLDDRGQKISLPGTERVEIDSEGQVRQGNNVVATLGIYDGAFSKLGNSLWMSADAKPLPNPTLAVASIEGSNVDAISSMVDLIKIQRSFEQSQKSIQTQDEMTGKLFEILNRR
jgi:flagellar basal body rod protein FlgG